jgi:hypothetical protein
LPRKGNVRFHTVFRPSRSLFAPACPWHLMRMSLLSSMIAASGPPSLRGRDLHIVDHHACCALKD